MNIIKKQILVDEFEPDIFCCDTLHQLFQNSLLSMSDNGFGLIMSTVKDTNINFCPFCGEKINIINKKLF